MKGLTRKVAAVLLAVSMLLPVGAAMSASAAEDTDASMQSVTVAVQNNGGTLTVTDAAGSQYVLNSKTKKQTISVPVGSILQTSAAAEDGYGQLLKHIGSDTQILNFETEDPTEISRLKQGMTDYKISFVEMPDMQKGDGFTQFMIDASDSPKVNAFLRTYTQIAHQYMSADEYVNTGMKKQWDEIHEKAVAEKVKDQPDQEQVLDEEKNQTDNKENPGSDRVVYSSEQMEQLRRDEIYRQTRLQERTRIINFAPEELVSETEKSMFFRVNGGDHIFAVPKDHVRKMQEQYAVVFLSEQEYAMLPVSASKGRIAEEAVQNISRIRGIELAERCMEFRMEKAEQTADAIVKELAKDISEKMPVKM